MTLLTSSSPVAVRLTPQSRVAAGAAVGCLLAMSAGLLGSARPVAADPQASGPVLWLQPGSIDFGRVPIETHSNGVGGSVKSAEAHTSVRIYNTGQGNLVLSGAARTAHFFLSLPLWAPNSPGIIIPPNGYVEYPVFFSATQAGHYKESIALNSNTIRGYRELVVEATVPSPFVVPIQTGVGVNGSPFKMLLNEVQIDRNPLDFGTVSMDTTKLSSIYVTNASDSTLLITGLSATGPGFSVPAQNAINVPIAPGARMPVGVAFHPVNAGQAHAGSLVITTNSTISKRTVKLEGTGDAAPRPALGIDAEQVGFGAQIVGTESEARQIQLTNTGGDTLVIDSLDLPEGPFRVVADTGETTLAPGETRTLAVVFAPAAVDNFEVTLTIQSDAVDGPRSIVLTGEGIAADAEPVAEEQPAEG